MSEHDGHRHRIIEKLDTGVLCEHELLEILLFNALPRRNTNDLAHRLLTAFGSIRGVFSASVEQLKLVDGVGENVAAYLRCIGRFYETYYEADKEAFPRRFDPEAFISYINERYARMDREVLDFYLLDERKNIVFCKRFTIDNPQRVVMNPEELTKLILVNKPSGVAVVHNHLSGSCFPSPSDDKTTNQIQLICSIHNVLFCDHYIYSPVGVYSYYRSGRMKEINREFSIGAILKERGGV